MQVQANRSNNKTTGIRNKSKPIVTVKQKLFIVREY
jgi:hypothetical protein